MQLCVSPLNSYRQRRVDCAPHSIASVQTEDHKLLYKEQRRDQVTYGCNELHVADHVLVAFPLFGEACEINIVLSRHFRILNY
jgi:hypothetical protein